MARGALWAAVILLAGGPALAQGDPAERVQALRQVADQKAEAQARDVLAEADKLAKASPTTAVKRLKEAIRGLDISVEISGTKRQELVKFLQGRIDTIEGRAATTPKKDDQRKTLEVVAAEAKDIRDTVNDIDKLYAANKTVEARAKADALVRKYPNNPAALVLAGQGMVQDRVAEAKSLSKEMNDRYVSALNDVQRSALPARGDIEFPKDYQARMAARDKFFGVKLSPEEEAILKALDTPVKRELRDAPFEETVQTLSNIIDKPIYLEKTSLEDRGVDLRRPVTMPGNVTARTALRAILQAQGLTYIIKDKVIQVVTLEKARETLLTRTYYLGELVAGTGPFGGAATWGPVMDFQQTQRNAQTVVDAITQSVDPLNWRTASNPNGISSIVFDPVSLSLIVRAPAELHAMLGKSMSRR